MKTVFSCPRKIENLFTNENGETAIPSFGSIGLSLYQSLWAYNGWNLLSCIIEELKEPEKNMPKALVISMASVTTLYLFTNFAYLSVLGHKGLLFSAAVGSTFANKILIGLGTEI